MRTIQFQYEGYDEVHQAEECFFEDQVAQIRSRLGIPSWIDYKILPDAHPEPYPELTSYLSHVCNSTEPTVVPKRTRKAKAGQEATNMSTMLNVLGDTNPLDLVPAVLRDKFTRLDNTVSNRMDK
jgi:hypothetical protein